MSRKPKKMKDEEVPYESMVEGVSSAHSWIKSNTMLRPTKLSRKKGDGSDGEDDDEADILILITSRIPNTRGNQVKWVEVAGRVRILNFSAGSLWTASTSRLPSRRR